MPAGATPRTRLSRLAAWVLQADRPAPDYGLRLPGLEIAPADGDAHKPALPGGAGAVA